MSNFKSECRKFQPNIFNKIKCSNCFRQRDEHSAEALESNRASRKVSKCGYLFVAPDWDFSNPLNRTKRWQRRWFVLYDDGELTYSVDDLPATIPQGVIDMNRVLEVSEAEDLTGNQFALAITSPDRATFVKGTCREESRWWRDVLSVFPRTHKSGRHKRNATFPGIKSSSASLQKSRNALGRTPSPSLAPSFDPSQSQRVRFHSCTSDSFSNVGRPASAPTFGGQDDVFPTKDPPLLGGGGSPDSPSTPTPVYHSTPMTSLPPSTRLLNDEHKENTPPYIQDYHDNPPTSESPPTQDKVMGHRPRTRRTAKREARGLVHPRSKSAVSLLPPFTPTNALSPMIPSSAPAHTNTLAAPPASAPQSHLEEYSNLKNKRTSRRNTVTSAPSLASTGGPYISPFTANPHLKPGGGTVHAWREEEGPEGARTPRNRYSDFPSMKRFLTSNLIRSSGDLSHQLIITDLEESKRGEKLKDIADSLTRPRGKSSLAYLNKENGVKPTRESEVSPDQLKTTLFPLGDLTTDSLLSEQIRGDPDGCGLDGDPGRFRSVSDTQRVDLPAEDILYIKKGWLLKQGFSQEWSKHWFVLEGSGLKFYRDPGAEDNGILDGIIDLGLVKEVQEKEVGRNYGFVVKTWDDKNLVFSAVTCGIRTNWIQAMRNAANLSPPQGIPLTLGEKLEKEISATKDTCDSSFASVEAERDAMTSSSSTTMGHSRLSSDEDFKTASDSSFLRDLSRHDSNADCDRVTSRATSRSSPLTSRSRSSPPPSRRGTKDDFPSISSNACLSEADSIPSMQDLDRHLTPERDSSGTLGSTGESMLMDLLETQVESLKAKLEQTQISGLSRLDGGIEEKNEIIEKIEAIRKQLQEERKEWEGKLMIEEDKVRELKVSQGKHAEIVRTLSRSLQEAELKVSSLTQELTKVGIQSSVSKKSDYESSLRAENIDVKKQVVELSKEVSRLQETLKSEKSEVYKWKDLVKELRSLLDGRNHDMEAKREEVQSLRERLRQTQVELDSTADRLHRGIEENEGLCGRLRELEMSSQSSHTQTQSKVRRGSSNLSISSSREKFSSKKNLPRMDSLSDLTNFDLNVNPEELEKESLVDEYTDLRLRFEKAVNEIRALKREVRGAETLQDDMELTNQRLRAELQTQESDFHAQIQLMGTRVQDLTTKLNNSEKQVRSLKQKITRTESKERRRTLSLKGRESFSLSKDLEAKLSLLEEKVASIYLQRDRDQLPDPNQKPSSVLKEAKRSKSFEDATKKSRQRRKSLDGTPTEEDALKAVIRVNALEERVSAFYGKDLKKASSTSLSSCSTPEGNSIQNYGPTSRSKSPLMSPLRSPASPRKMSSSRSTKLHSDKAPKLTRSESEPKLLREKVSSLERVLSTVQAKLSECQTCTKTLECSCSCGSTSLSRLRELLSSTAHVAQFRHSQCDQVAVRRVRPIALRLQDLLKDKMAQLVQRRHQLRAAGKWTRDAQLKGFAERLAFETTLLSQLAQALQAAQNPKSFEASLRLQELIEAHRKLSFLEKKLSNPEFDMEPMTPLEFYSSLLAEKLVIEGDILGVMSSPGGNSRGRSAATFALNETCKDLLGKVLERERTLAGLVTRYKEKKLYDIAVVMARETVTGTQPSHDDSVLLEELRLREAWGMAQDILTQEIINLEASQSVLRLSNLLVPAGSDFSCVAPQMISASLDRLQTGAEDSLRQEMEESVFTLSAKYEEVLSQYRSGDKAIITSVESSMEAVLGEFAAVIAQKALIDGQLAVATGDDSASTTTDPLTIVEEKIDPLECAGDVAASESHLLMFLGGGNDPSTEGLVTSAMTQAEFAFIYNKVAVQSASEAAGLVSTPVRDATGSQKSLNSSASDRDIETEASSFTSTASFGGPKIPPSPKSTRRRVDTSRKSRRASDITGMVENCRQCEELRQEVNRLKKSLEGRRLRKQEAECKKCIEYLQALKDLEEDHRMALEALQSQHQGEIDRLRDQVKYDPPTRDSDDELTELKRRLCLLEEGYEAQIAALKKQYQEALGSQSDVCEENIRQRYQLEIEHLRELCEKGLTAMESSHRRLVSEMEEKHRREMEALQAEKEEALAEETQATLAALDAMRKAHEAEVQKEVAKFKEEFLRRAENGLEDKAEHSRLHEEEIREVRREILQLSEKYSSKCLEMAAKEQKLESLQRQLTESKAQTRSLEERNRLLKQRLNTHLSHLQTNNTKSPEEIQHQHECELTLKDEEIAWLNQMLQKSKMHESDLGSLCGQLGRFLKTEKSHRTDANTSVLRDKLETHIMTAVRLKGNQNDLSAGTNHSSELERKDLERSFSKEVSRSPSCPGLSRFSTFLWKGAKDPPLWGASPLLGMVAQRKKVFEGPPTSKTEC